VEGKIAWYPGYPVTTNHPAEAQKVREVATALLGESAVSWNGNPSMASEDFACMLEACPAPISGLAPMARRRQSRCITPAMILTMR
jgi:metal-dependent amidase/aminoacylase/carboxypeptidase family protein